MSKRWFITLFVALPCVVWTFVYQYHIAEFGEFKGVIQSDGKGYYAYLPAVWIEGDLSWNFFFDKDNEDMLQHFDKRFLTSQNEKWLLKTYCGESILLSPFFLAGTIKSKISGNRCTGYEPYMQGMVHVAALFYLILGLWYWMKFLSLYHLKKNVIYTSVIAIVFATNLFHYASVEVTMTHVYSFCMMACFLYAGKQLLENPVRAYFIGCAITLALIALLRPVNLMVVLILPFLADWSKFKNLIYSKPGYWIISAWVFLLICSIQPTLNFLQCGILFPWSYGEEGFFWTRPEIANVLFSFRKGLFIYTPVFFLVVISFWIGWKTNKRIIIGVLIIAICALYLISAWWSWYYGPGYAHRAFIDWYPVLFIPLVIGLNQFKVWPKRIYGFAISLCVLLNLFQTYQYEAGILEKEDMSAGGYKAVFLQWKPEFKNILAGEHELHYLPLDRNLADTLMEFTGMNAVEGAQFRDMLIFDKTRLFSPVFTFVDKSNGLSQSTMLRARLKIRELERDACRNTVLVLSVSNALGERVLYQPMRFRDYPDYSNPEREFTVEQLIRPIDAVGCKVDIYVFNPDTTIFALDEISVKIQSFRREIH